MKKCVVFVVMACVSVSFLTLLGCTDKKATSAQDVEGVEEDTAVVDSLELLAASAKMPKGADELFDDFIFNFASNRGLQLQRIAFPLMVEKNGKQLSMNRNQWKTEHFFMSQDYYTIIFNNRKEMELMKDTTVSNAVIEKIYLEKGWVQQYFFDRSTGSWMMRKMKEVPMDKSIHASFLKFYKHFSTDEAFQVESMNNSVEFTAPDPDDDFNTMTGEIFPEQWPSFKPGLIPSGFIYNIEYGKISGGSNTKIFVTRGIANGYETEMTFKMIGGKWKLVKFTT
ncbi:MAG: DUF4348 domain-containing protein [Prevotella sp.]|nr:DUF4348 domain-containing protein [Prevotella sp.]